MVNKRRRTGTGGYKKHAMPYKKSRLSSAVQKAVRRAVTGEVKYADTVLNMTAVAPVASSGANMQQLGVIEQGTGPNQRIGRKVRAVKLRIKGELYVEPILQASNQGIETIGYTRLVVFCDKNRNKSTTLPNFEDIFKRLAGPDDEPLDPGAAQWSFRNLDNLERFKVLYDKNHYFNTDWTYNGDTAAMYPIWKIKGINISRNLDLDIEYADTV